MATTRYAPTDWHTANTVIATSAERQRGATHDVRQQSYRLRNETDIKTHWSQYTNDTKLNCRVADITTWKDTLEKTVSETEKEMDLLSTVKSISEKALEAKGMPLDIVIDCLSLREGRVSIDNVRDEVESELNTELKVLEAIRNLLHQKITETFEQLQVLHGCHCQLQGDLGDKHSALNIDTDCAQLTNHSSAITTHIDPTRIMKKIVSPDQWEAFSTHNMLQTEYEVQLSVRLRENINHTIEQTTHDLNSQWTATDYALRRRVHELQQTIAELQWQKTNTETEIAKVQQEIQQLQFALDNKLHPMMVAQTRLENRTQRQNVELCRDPPQYRLVEEVSEIGQSQQELMEELALAQQGLGTLSRTLERIKDDLSVKENSLQLDNHCLEIRKKLSEHPDPQQLARMIKKEE